MVYQSNRANVIPIKKLQGQNWHCIDTAFSTFLAC